MSQEKIYLCQACLCVGNEAGGHLLCHRHQDRKGQWVGERVDLPLPRSRRRGRSRSPVRRPPGRGQVEDDTTSARPPARPGQERGASTTGSRSRSPLTRRRPSRERAASTTGSRSRSPLTRRRPGWERDTSTTGSRRPHIRGRGRSRGRGGSGAVGRQVIVSLNHSCVTCSFLTLYSFSLLSSGIQRQRAITFNF